MHIGSHVTWHVYMYKLLIFMGNYNSSVNMIDPFLVVDFFVQLRTLAVVVLQSCLLR